VNTKRLELFPITAEVGSRNHLIIGGCDCTGLLRRYGSPLYIFDEATIRQQCREYRHEFGIRYKNTVAAYACKALINRPLATLMKEEGMDLDVVSGGELAIAQSVDFPAERVHFHGNNKTPEELKLALDYKIGRIIVDNFYELEMLNDLAGEKKIKVDILLRLNPSVDPHTHKHTTTGILDSKFGFPIGTGQAEQAVIQSMSLKNLKLRGLHFHLGSPVTETEPYMQGLTVVLKFAAQMKKKSRFEMEELSPGGGFPVKYISSAELPPLSRYADTIIRNMVSLTTNLGLAQPKLIIEPGRSIIARAGVAVYTIGAIKDIPGVRKYVCVDGGMGDNIRPALYDAKYEALLANRVNAENVSKVTFAGKYCESGDILIRDIAMPETKPGDVVAIPVCGAYCIPMSSNYNMVPHPAIIMVNEGRARIIRRRQKYADLMKYDIMGKA
jgi:diaminopimelate decarboxylase